MSETELNNRITSFPTPRMYSPAQSRFQSALVTDGEVATRSPHLVIIGFDQQEQINRGRSQGRGNQRRGTRGERSEGREERGEGSQRRGGGARGGGASVGGARVRGARDKGARGGGARGGVYRVGIQGWGTQGPGAVCSRIEDSRRGFRSERSGKEQVQNQSKNRQLGKS